MNKQVSSLTNQQSYTQEVFWTWINESVRQTVVDLAQKAMELIRDSRLEAGWNQRNVGRRGYRNGYYRRWLTTPHGAVKLKVPRCRAGARSSSVIKDESRTWSISCDMLICWVALQGDLLNWRSKSSAALSAIRPSAD